MCDLFAYCGFLPFEGVCTFGWLLLNRERYFQTFLVSHSLVSVRVVKIEKKLWEQLISQTLKWLSHLHTPDQSPQTTLTPEGLIPLNEFQALNIELFFPTVYYFPWKFLLSHLLPSFLTICPFNSHFSPLSPCTLLSGSHGVGVKTLRYADLVALALKSLWFAGSDPGQAQPLTLTGGTHLSPWKLSNQPIRKPESESAAIQRKSAFRFYSLVLCLKLFKCAFFLEFLFWPLSVKFVFVNVWQNVTN